MELQMGLMKVGNSAKSNCKIYFQKNLAWKIELVHLVKNKQNKGKKTKPTAIVCKTLSYKHKNEVLKNTKILFINEDFCHETMQHSKDVKRLHSEGQLACSNYRSIVAERRGD